ncbi:MAG: extracellular solute-binding protein, partial [Leifsonia sp.]
MNRIPRRRIAAVAAAIAATAMLAACSGGGGSDTIASTAPTKLEGTVSLWHFFTDREAKVIQSVVDDFEKANPGVKVTVHSGQDDDKLQKAISAGTNVDVGISYSTDIVGSFCSSGAFRDLGPYISRDKVDLSQFSDTVRSYTEYKKTRCAMPVLADVYGLYYNKKELADAGFTAPPKTLDELDTMALKLTTYNA